MHICVCMCERKCVWERPTFQICYTNVCQMLWLWQMSYLLICGRPQLMKVSVSFSQSWREGEHKGFIPFAFLLLILVCFVKLFATRHNKMNEGFPLHTHSHLRHPWSCCLPPSFFSCPGFSATCKDSAVHFFSNAYRWHSFRLIPSSLS